MTKENRLCPATFKYMEIGAGQEVLQKKRNENNYLLFLLSGELEMVYGSLKPRVISNGNAVLLSSLSDCVCTAQTPVKIIWLEFNSLISGCDKYVFQSLAPIFTLIKYEFRELEIRYPLDLYLHLIIDYLDKNILNKDLLPDKVKELVTILRAFYNSEELTMLFYPLLGKNMEFKKMIIDNYMKVKNASEYAKLCGYGIGVFQRKFKEVFGETVYQWMQRQKAEQIKHCLMVTDANPKELAEEFHFTSPTHLNKFCKIWFGMTPSELRQTYLLKKNLK